MQSVELMNKCFEQYADLKVKLIAIPLPPISVGGLVYRPDCFVSRTFDKDVIDYTEGFDIISIKPSHLGPIVLAYVKLSKLINCNNISNTGNLSVNSSAICATVDLYKSKETSDGEAEYAKDVVIENFNFRSSSCHPGSHYVIPRAPYLTSILQYAQSKEDCLFKYLSCEESELFFTGVNFNMNQAVDRFIGSCPIQQGVSFMKVSSLGNWCLPFLQKLRRNRINKIGEKESHEIIRNQLVGWSSKENDSKDWNSPISRGIEAEVCR